MFTIIFTATLFRAMWKMFVWGLKATWWMMKFCFKVALFPLVIIGTAFGWLFP